MILADMSRSAAESGIGLGAAIAVTLSWYRNKSIVMAVIHGVLSWLYVIYFAMTRRKNER